MDPWILQESVERPPARDKQCQRLRTTQQTARPLSDKTDTMDASNPPSQLEFGGLSGSTSGGGRPKQRGRGRAASVRQILPEGAPYALFERDAVEWLRGLPDESIETFTHL